MQMRSGPDSLGDFTATRRMLPIAALAVGLGALGAYLSTALLALINFFTNLFFFHRLSIAAASPAEHTMGLLGVAVPVLGCVIVGLMARYGSERIRGHGIPEALEAILIRGSRVQPRVALLKPISAAVSIGSGGPFGAEGPIIMTGGAFGSMLAQVFHLTAAERKTLLVAGAAAGMSATFNAPIASVFLAVELLLFELKPRSLVPVALASVTAAYVRQLRQGGGAIFPLPALPASLSLSPSALIACAVLGVAAGCLSAALTAMVYASEDAFGSLKRLHWMWWPAIGGLVVGVGGLLCPQALGVGYDQIQSLLMGGRGAGATVRLLVVKSVIWAVSLGSGTSGGVLAPLLMMGAALGVLATPLLPAVGASFWPLVGMSAILGGTMRAPLTALVFAIELTGRFSMSLPLLTACAAAHAFTVLVLKRSILTEKVARRGFHVSREYAIDPLEILTAGEVMRPGPFEQGASAGDGTRWTSARADEPLRLVVHRMAETGCTALPVVDAADPSHRLGLVTLEDVLKARLRHLEEERRREGIVPLNVVRPLARRFAGLRRGRGRARKAG